MEADSWTTRSGALLPMVKLRIWGITPMKKPTICQKNKKRNKTILCIWRLTTTLDSSILTVLR